MVLRRLPPDGPGRPDRSYARHQARANRSSTFPAAASTCGTSATSSSRAGPTAGATRSAAIASMLLESEKIYPAHAEPGAARPTRRRSDWAENHDVQVFRNLKEHPRSWVVHSLRRLPDVTELRPGYERQIDDAGDHLLQRPHLDESHSQRLRLPQRRLGRPGRLRARSSPIPMARGLAASEAVKVRYPSPQRVELDVTLGSPGVVVLADVYYPGWKLDDRRQARTHLLGPIASCEGPRSARDTIGWSTPTTRHHSGSARSSPPRDSLSCSCSEWPASAGRLNPRSPRTKAEE